MKTPELRWGILGTGWIADRFVADLALLEGHRVRGVGSRSLGKAAFFAKTHGIPTAHGSYEELVADPELDVIYVASPHPSHHDHACMALEAGKHVLVEKPFAMDAQQAERMVALARTKKRFLMEAMWTRFLPHMIRVRELLAEKILGEIITIQADHGQWFPKNPEHRLFSPTLGGGALLDLGIYPISFAAMVMGQPMKVTAISSPAFTGVDAQTSIILQYPGGAHALLSTTLSAACPNRAVIAGTEARLEIEGAFYAPSKFKVIHRDGRILENWDKAYHGHGLREQAAELGRCIAAGLSESPLLPLDESVAIMATMDEVRAQIGLGYSFLS